ncbi:hypothetical protein L2E82_30412 [Cichorium intybus]|uniref:Uncharacterized protein n=1 Tax=Cichorium intybus TaxID=13427 RepID=A0ACB9D0F9_CICIN|nr:hypothetical protein L2E82_30412 [Cichorium intybus]
MASSLSSFEFKFLLPKRPKLKFPFHLPNPFPKASAPLRKTNTLKQKPAYSPPPADVDLMSLCKNGSIKEAIELLSQGLIKVYMKCNSMMDARRVFDKMRERDDLNLWHSMINDHIDNNKPNAGLLLYNQIKELGLTPNGETFRLLLSACTSIDSVQECFKHFKSMKTEYSVFIAAVTVGGFRLHGPLWVGIGGLGGEICEK